ncbi:Fic family protein [Candidatus Woesearchaeota archaeon]|nr:Fic family protein [Candidatus Woesearchaeota archaeon]
MANLKKRIIGNQTYYYLEHSLRKNGRLVKKQKYLGKQIPKNIEQIKKEFLSEIYREKWFSLFDQIKINYLKEIKKMPLSAREKELNAFAVKFTYDTQRIEGSALTLRETANLLERGITPSNRPIGDVKEAEAHKAAFYEMIHYERDLSMQTVLHWHKKLFEQTKPEIAGKIRHHQVKISGSKFMPPLALEIDILLRDFFNWYSKHKSKKHAVELAALTHLRFVTIHPFTDGNGRISRLIMNFVLNQNGYPMMDVYYENRNSYYNALERSQVKKDEGIFLKWFFKRYLKEYKGYCG